MKVLDLFSGIGGFSIGLETAGMETVAFCEIEDYPCKVLKKHWPDVPIYNDVRTLTYDRLKADGITRIDVICGGFPCQDISVAGNQKGISSETRSGLWSECARLLGEIRPQYAIFENVTALLNGGGGDWFKRVLWDISQVGYDAEWHCIPASELGAHHHRDRIWIIAYPSEIRCDNGSDNRQERHLQNDEKRQSQKIQPEGDKRQSGTSEAREVLSDTMREGLEGHREPRSNEPAVSEKRQSILGAHRKGSVRAECWATESRICRVVDGISDRSHRLKALGNAVVPQIPELIGRAIMEAENEKNYQL